MKKLTEKYNIIRKKINAYNFISFVTHWDSETEAPPGCFANRSRQIGIISEELYKIRTSKETALIINQLYKNRRRLDPLLAHEITVFKRNLTRMKKIPIKEYVQLQKLLAHSTKIWEHAKKTNDFTAFQPTLEKIVYYTKQQIKRMETKSLRGYDILLDKYERGYTTKQYDLFFQELKVNLVPFIHKVAGKKIDYNNDFLFKQYPTEKQKEFIAYLHSVFQYDPARGLTKESEHPFTTSFGPSDVRYANHFYESNFTSAIFSAIHELGHALYEQQGSPELEETLSWGGGSMALHESQSRFYENMIGRSRNFWKEHFPVLKTIFKKQLTGVTLRDFYRGINEVKPSLIRVNADELTYPVHIMIRYDIEKALFNDEILIKDLPQIWNDKVQEYLGISVPDDARGVLQDVHWAGGMFGYFPAYALGSAYAAQIYRTMNKDFNIMKSLRNKNTEEINNWLKINLHSFGSSKEPKVLFKHVARGTFNPKYYIKYLIKKYSKLYDIL